MPAKSPETAQDAAAMLAELGQRIQAHRKAMRISATSAAQAAGMSRMTLHRIEAGEPSVTMGAYLNAMAALGLELEVGMPSKAAPSASEHGGEGWIPARIKLAEYPQLKQLAWQVQGTDELTPPEALSIYERNWRHLDREALEPREQQLIDALRLALGRGKADV